MKSNNHAPIVVIGAGLAGFTFARELRKLDPDVALMMFTNDLGDYYYKPNLSAALTQRKDAASLVMTRRQDIAAQLNITIHHSCSVVAIDTDQKQIRTAGGDIQEYASLILALGAQERIPDLPAEDRLHLHSVNDLVSYARFREELLQKRSVLICGAGLVGCEFAHDLAAAGYDVAVVSSGGGPLSGLAPPEIGRFIESRLSDLGIEWHFHATLNAVKKTPRRYQVSITGGNKLEADLVFSAIGICPNTALARHAGIHIERGISVDQALRTNAKDVYALGDCAEIGGRLLPFVAPIIHCAKVVAANVMSTPSMVKFPPMPIVVKLPHAPTILCPPLVGEGTWFTEYSSSGVKATCRDQQQNLLGFALTGDTTPEKNVLIKQLNSPTDF